MHPAEVLIILLGCAQYVASFSPASNVVSANSYSALRMCAREPQSTEGNVAEGRQLQMGATSRREWMGNVLKGIGVVAVGKKQIKPPS